MAFSRSLTQELKKYDITAEEKAFLDLMVLGWNKKDAYTVTFGESVMYSDNYISSTINELLESDKGKQYMQSVKKQTSTNHEQQNTIQSNDIGLQEALSMATKEETLKDLIIAKSNMKIGTKEWIDVTKLIADLQQMKKEEVQEEDNTIHYYLPLSCYNCSLYQKNIKK